MKIAVINETSAADRNADILAALEGHGHDVINVGMTKNSVEPQLLYTHTGLMSALLLNTKRVDFVVGGCGTGQGYLNSVMQYPGVFCGHVINSLDAWLFTQINGGNCISLMLNQGYGWAADINLKFIFERIISVEVGGGGGFPSYRREPQQAARLKLEEISLATHRLMAEIVQSMPHDVLLPALAYPGMWDLLDVDTIGDKLLKKVLLDYYKK